MTRKHKRTSWTAMFSFAATIAFALAFSALAPEPAFAAMRSEIRTGLSDAQKLAQATPPDFAAALAKAKEVDAAITDKNAEEEYNVAKFIGYVAISLEDYKAAQDAYNRAMTSGGIPEAEQVGVYNAALLLNFQNQDYAKAVTAGTELQKLGPLDDKSLVVYSQAYYFSNDFAGSERVAKAGVDQITAAGQKPSEDLLVTLMNAQKDGNNSAAALATQEQITSLYPTAENWNRLVDRAIDASATSDVKDPLVRDHRIITLYRLRLQAGDMKADDYAAMGSLLLSAGLPGEAKAVLNKGVTAGTITRSGNTGQLLARAEKEAGPDEKSLPGLAKIAAGQKNGEIDVKLGESYWSYGNTAEAEAAIQRGISKGGLKDPGEALITLGLVQLSAGKKDAAVQSFEQAAAKPANAAAARAWAAYAKAQA